jgi:hypothetical protein
MVPCSRHLLFRRTHRHDPTPLVTRKCLTLAPGKLRFWSLGSVPSSVEASALVSSHATRHLSKLCQKKRSSFAGRESITSATSM